MTTYNESSAGQIAKMREDLAKGCERLHNDTGMFPTRVALDGLHSQHGYDQKLFPFNFDVMLGGKLKKARAEWDGPVGIKVCLLPRHGPSSFEDVCSQLDRYGLYDDVLDVLWALSEFNDDRCHGRERVDQSFRRLVKAVSDLEDFGR